MVFGRSIEGLGRCLVGEEQQGLVRVGQGKARERKGCTHLDAKTDADWPVDAQHDRII